jgi:hypothetical protein
MRNTIKASLMTAAILALMGTTGYAATTSSAITLSATIPTTDSITCSTTTVDFGTAIVDGATPTGTVSCTVSSNDTYGVEMSVYVPGTNALTGLVTTNAIPATDLSAGASAGAVTALSDLFTGSTALTGAFGVDIAALGTGGTPIVAAAETISLALHVPATQAADTYTGTLYVLITPLTT